LLKVIAVRAKCYHCAGFFEVFGYRVAYHFRSKDVFEEPHIRA
jgi:hypothetical protein